MKIISLNTWAGRCTWALTRFFRKYRDHVDVFCLQEIHDTSQSAVDERHPDEFVRGDIFEVIAGELEAHVGVFAPHWDDTVRMSNAMFVRRGIGGLTFDSRVIHQPEKPIEEGSFVITARRMQSVSVMMPHGRLIHIGNVHGLWNGTGRGDSPERQEQSRRILETMNALSGPKVLMGDFNIYPNTVSWHLLFRAFDDELVMKKCISSTRTPLYRKYADIENEMPIDFCFVSGVKVKEFRALPDVVSDHAPLYLEIE